MSQLSYAAAGVSIDAGDELVERIKPFAKRTMIPGVLGSIGGFGALFEVSKEYKNPVLVTARTAWAPSSCSPSSSAVTTRSARTSLP